MYGSTRANDGYRARIGIVIPSVNTVVEAWFARAAPEGVSLHVSRMPIAPATTLEAIMEMAKHEVAATRLVADCEPDVIMYACTASTIVRGRAYDLELMETLSQAVGVPTYTTPRRSFAPWACSSPPDQRGDTVPGGDRRTRARVPRGVRARGGEPRELRYRRQPRARRPIAGRDLPAGPGRPSCPGATRC